MTDVPPGNDGPAGEPDPDAFQGRRRSTFTPPEANAAPPSFDDDALADVLAAQVSSYTAPITVTPPLERSATPATPAEPELAAEPEASAGPDMPAATDAPPEPGLPSTVDPSSSATLDAIERLESELRRRADDAQVAPPAPVQVAPIDIQPPPMVPPEPHVPPDGERLFPSPFRPFGAGPVATPSEPLPEAPLFADPPPETLPEAPSFSEPPSFAEPPSFPQPPSDPEPSSFAPPEPDYDEELPPSWEVAPPPTYLPPALVEPPSFGMPEPATPTPLESSPPPPGAQVFDAPPPNPGFGTPPLTPPIDLPPPGAAALVDLAHLPPPRGIEPAALPPYEPDLPNSGLRDDGNESTRTGALAPLASDFEALLGAPHPDDLPSPNVADPEIGMPTTPFTDEDDDVVDDVDRAFGSAPIAVDSTGAAGIVAPPSEPVATLRLGDDEAAMVDEELEHHPAFLVEHAGVEPTPHDLRAGRAARMFWLWFATNSSVVSLTIGAVLLGMGMSVRQALVAILIGVAISFLPLGLVTLAGKWSGQPTMIVSRATFGLVGNALPAVLALVSRVFWGGALLWMLSAGVASVLVDAGLDAGLGAQVWTLVGLAAGFLIAFVVAVFGYGLIARLQLILSIVTGLLVIGLIVITSPHLNVAAAQNIADGPWILLVSGIVLVFSFVGLAWVHSSADVARYQRAGSDGGSTMLWATFGATLPAFLLIAWGALLAASDPVLAQALATNPVHAIASLLPLWYPAPLLAATALGLLSGVVLTIYSGGFALQSLGVRGRRSFTTVLAGILVLAMGAGLVFLVTDARELVRDVATTIAVPVAAWAGIFVAEMMIRSRFSAGFHSDSLLRRGGIYPAVRWGNLIGLILITVVGFGLTSAVLPGLDWQGYLLPFLGLGANDPLLTSDVGVLVALVLGILLPLVSAVPAIRRQSQPLVDSEP
ncbi:MAG: cytosine permease [Pseudolysinimonas sp.]|uniref:purine-cytosine permease family protein n=1 Tax=Pseudolysinimonas sp. TaxID=2680009 RepID=UPI003267FC54